MNILTVWLKQIRTYLYTGNLGYFQAQKWWEPDELRGSRPVLRGAEAEMPRSTHPYIWTHEGWLYLTITLDLFSREVVGWAMGNRLTGKLVIDALNMAFFKRQPDPGLVHHSDQGSQYCSLDFQKLLASYSMLSSMSRKGDCFDNAVAESFFSTLKTERIFFSNYKTREEAKRSIVEYVEMFYNSNRLHSYLGYVSPREFEKMWHLEKVA